MKYREFLVKRISRADPREGASDISGIKLRMMFLFIQPISLMQWAGIAAI